MSSSPLNPPSRWLPFLLAVAVFMQMLDATILNTALPQMAKDLGESPLQMQSAVISYALTLALLMPLSGYLCDRYGTRQVFLVAMLIFVAGSVLCAAAPNLQILVVARVVQGMGGAMLMPVPRLVMLRAYEKNRLLAMMNYVVMPALLGPIVGPLVGGYLVEYASWHWIFLINVPFGLFGAWLTRKIMPDFRSSNPHIHFDMAGFLLFGAGAVGLSLAVEMLTHPGAGFFCATVASLALCSLWLYWRHAQKDSEALYTTDLFLVRTYRLGLSGNLVSRLGMSAVPFLLPLLIQVALGRSATDSGWTLAPVALAAMLAKPLVKPLMTKFGYRRTLTTNTCLIGILIALLSLPSPATPLWQLTPLLLLLGACNSIQFTAMNTLTIADLRPYQAGSGNSLMAVNQQLAIGFGIAIGASLINIFNRYLDLDTLWSFRYTFLTIGALTFLSSFIFSRLHPRDGDNLVH